MANTDKNTDTVSQTLPDNHKNATNVLLNSLAELEVMFEPLFATRNSLAETLAKLDVEKRCQLELLLAYAINTLAFINLRTNGTEPKTHPVMNELKRIREYTEKLRRATQGNIKGNMEVDKDAASRFIRGALAANEIADRKAAEAETTETKTKSEADKKGSNNNKDNTKSNRDVATPTNASSPSSPSDSASGATKISSTHKRRGMDPFQGYSDNKKKSKAK
ncbi:hypothetical protein BG011_000080 [Mortierella polycephala]|uniref:Exosome complex protein n=1 Tax=Mortierella polycephala TaxID=41804 RepID=A0A9P6Q8L3_9FUNG|nr:hypothetical protein BG011_000080 [Mortierella polycephala]